MMTIDQRLETLRSGIAALSPLTRCGRISAIGRGGISVTGLSAWARLGDRVEIGARGGRRMGGEVVSLGSRQLRMLTEDHAEGLAIGDPVTLLGASTLAPHDGWIGRIVDPLGRPLDGRPLLSGGAGRPLRAPPPAAAERRKLGPRLETAMAIFDTFLPLARGQRIGLFAGSGVGKSTLLARFARRVEADIVVIALIGERGRELRDFVEDALGPEGMRRAVVVAATSDQSPLLRRRCAWAAMAAAEHFRDQGRHVLLLADSVTRFAEAHREVALAAGESAGLRGYPPSTAHEIMALGERAGTGTGAEASGGDITAVFSVLVAGSDMEEPVADILRGVLDGHVVLDRAIAERGRFPAVDLLRSVSRCLPGVAQETENRLLGSARSLLGAYERAEMMIQAGLYTSGNDPQIDRAITLWPALDAFMAADSASIADSFARLATLPGLAASGSRAASGSDRPGTAADDG